MAYESQSENVVRNRMINSMTTNVSKSEGSIVWDIASPFANEIAKQYIELDSILIRMFGQTTYGEYLDKRALEFGLTRKSGTKAAGKVEFFGKAGTVIPAGFLVQSQAGLQFQTLNQVTLDTNGVAAANIEAMDVGPEYNLIAGTITKVVVVLIGVTTVTNEASTSGGSNVESDDDFRARLLMRAQTPSSSGNVNHYKGWALETPGAGAVKVFPIWNGPGTVRVVLIDANKQPANQALLDAVKAHIEANRPIGSTVTIEAAVPLAINVAVTVSRKAGYDASTVRNNITDSLTEYLKEIAFERDYVSYANVGSVIFSTEGVADYSDLMLNGNNFMNINIGATQVAVVGTVIVQ